jgi:hypothetical protein
MRAVFSATHQGSARIPKEVHNGALYNEVRT